MGCWNGTCGITQMAILWNEPVVGFLIRKNFGGWSANGHCYSTDLWSPYSLPIEGKYNDYGTMEDVDEQGWNFLFTLDRLKQNVIEKENNDKYDDNSVKKDDITDWNYISKAIHENRLESSVDRVWDTLYPNVKSVPFGLMMIHGEVFNTIVNSTLKSWWGADVSIDGLMEEGREIVVALRKKYKEASSINDSRERSLRMDLFTLDIDRSMENRRFVNLIENREGSCYGIGREYFLYLTKMIAAGESDEAIEPVIRKMSEFYMIDMVMMKMRKTWMPQAGAGSQDNEIDLHLMINDITKGIFEKRKKDWDEG